MRGRRLVATTLVALAVSTATADAAPKPGVTLNTVSSFESLNAAVSLRAVAHGLARGDRVRIVARRDETAVTITVATCAKAVCVGHFRDSTDEGVSFRALVLRHGKTIARSASVDVAWEDTSPAPPLPPAPPPPPPAPSAAAGHYCGLTDEGKSVCFDVTAAPQSVVTNMRTESIASCGDGSSWMWTFSFPLPLSILEPGLTAGFQYTGPLPDRSSTTNIQVAYDVEATFDTAGNATGTLSLNHVSWDEGGKHYDCSGTARSWHARLGA